VCCARSSVLCALVRLWVSDSINMCTSMQPATYVVRLHVWLEWGCNDWVWWGRMHVCGLAARITGLACNACEFQHDAWSCAVSSSFLNNACFAAFSPKACITFAVRRGVGFGRGGGFLLGAIWTPIATQLATDVEKWLCVPRDQAHVTSTPDHADCGKHPTGL
jgi:hypothetical protein